MRVQLVLQPFQFCLRMFLLLLCQLSLDFLCSHRVVNQECQSCQCHIHEKKESSRSIVAYKCSFLEVLVRLHIHDGLWVNREVVPGNARQKQDVDKEKQPAFATIVAERYQQTEIDEVHACRQCCNPH